MGWLVQPPTYKEITVPPHPLRLYQPPTSIFEKKKTTNVGLSPDSRGPVPQVSIFHVHELLWLKRHRLAVLQLLGLGLLTTILF